jgi:2-polyprenyl-3-methyl-5-hydroxy-6-metoxy-1,4-benzoquinol methylase
MSANQEISSGERFEFGENWTRFLALLDEHRIAGAEQSLRDMLRVQELQDLTFLDIGSGSGLFSLAAKRLGAHVHSFDFDPKSVACARTLRDRYFPGNPDWVIEPGSALDGEYLRGLGQFDVVYSWGVLHHTGSMWLGFEHAISRVKPGGRLVIAIYNDQGWKSRVWWLIKAFYNRLSGPLQWVFRNALMGAIHAAMIIRQTLQGRPMEALRPLFDSSRERGMSAKYDAIDWIGGFPFEVASFELLEAYFAARGFKLIHSTRTSSWGCNEFSFRRAPCAD